MKGIINGKTLVGSIALGVLWFLSEMMNNGAIPVDLLPEWVVTVLMGISTFLVLFGLHDAAMQEFESWVAALQSFILTSPAVGIALYVLLEVAEKTMELYDDPYIDAIAQIVIGALMLFGIKKNLVAARLNNAPVSARAEKKYKKAA